MTDGRSRPRPPLSAARKAAFNGLQHVQSATKLAATGVFKMATVRDERVELREFISEDGARVWIGGIRGSNDQSQG